MKADPLSVRRGRRGETDDELWSKTEQHIQDKHPEMVGQYSREQILSMAHEH